MGTRMVNIRCTYITLLLADFILSLSGYRAVDSAQMYHNERDVGNAINDFLSSTANASKLSREDIHYTSKLASNSDYNTARKSIKRSVKECGLGKYSKRICHL